MSQIDVLTQWKSPQSVIPLPVRLRIIEEQGKTLALLSAPANGNAEDEQKLSDQLDLEFHHAATSVSILFCLKPLETIWLREFVHEEKSQVRRVIMDEKNGEMLNARYGTMMPWEAGVTRNVERFFTKTRKTKRASWEMILAIALFVISAMLVVKLHDEHQKQIILSEELKKKRRELEDMSQKVLMIDLIEKERLVATVPNPTLKRIYRQTTNHVAIPSKIPLKPLDMSHEKNDEKSWVELWNERVFPKSTNHVEP